MFDDATFIVKCDDEPEDVVNTIANVLSKFGLTIEIIKEENDGITEYQIMQDTRQIILPE